MQHQYWITKQTLYRKFGRKEDECITSCDAQLDSKLELFRNIQLSCSIIQNIVDKYQESICYLSQETNSIGRFLKDSNDQDKTRIGEIMSVIGKSLIFCAQQQLILREPLIRFYGELETFRNRAIGDTQKTVLDMEKARTEYRASLSWMKNISQQLDPDTFKQLEKFKKVQQQVRRGKINFDKFAMDSLQKVDLLAAARCNMLNHTLSFYQNKLLEYTGKSAKAHLLVLKTFTNEHSDDSEDNRHNKYQSTSIKNNITSTNKQEKLINTEDHSLDTDNDIKKTSTTNYSVFHENEQVESLAVGNADQEQIYDDLKSPSILNINWNTGYTDYFFPSQLIGQRHSNEQEETCAVKENVDHSSETRSTKAWLNLFEELDPLSNNLIEKSYTFKNSLI